MLLDALTAALQAVGVRRAAPVVDVTPLEGLSARLHRLQGEMARLLAADPRTPGLYRRLLAASLAYDGVLAEACQRLGLDQPGPPPLAGWARLAAEADLTEAGLRW